MNKLIIIKRYILLRPMISGHHLSVNDCETDGGNPLLLISIVPLMELKTYLFIYCIVHKR